MMMDIDRILKQAVDKENKMENLANFNRSAGVRESLNENLIPEQLFDDPNTQEKEAEGISAVKALQIASKEGQTIYTINQNNYSQILPKLNHSSDVMRDVANAMNAGKEVTISERQIRAFGWSGTGFIVLDPYTGYGAYLIDGGANGGILPMIGGTGFGILFSLIMSSFGAALVGGYMIPLIISLFIVTAVGYYLLRSYSVEQRECFWQGFGIGSAIGGLVGSSIVEKTKSQLMSQFESIWVQRLHSSSNWGAFFIGFGIDRFIANATVQDCYERGL